VRRRQLFFLLLLLWESLHRFETCVWPRHFFLLFLGGGEGTRAFSTQTYTGHWHQTTAIGYICVGKLESRDVVQRIPPRYHGKMTRQEYVAFVWVTTNCQLQYSPRHVSTLSEAPMMATEKINCWRYSFLATAFKISVLLMMPVYFSRTTVSSKREREERRLHSSADVSLVSSKNVKTSV
jgi:hypothetical protein